jgi:serine protease inhibitor
VLVNALEELTMRSRTTLSFAFALSLTALSCTPDAETSRPVPAACGEAGTAGCIVFSGKARINDPSVPDGDLKVAVAGNTAFALDLYQQLRTEKGNLFYSPFSISEALAIAYAGARAETESQMRKTLHFDLDQSKLHPAFNALGLALASRGMGASGADGQGFRLNIANALWGQLGHAFSTPFLDTIGENYGDGVHMADFVADADGSRKLINDWVAARTEDRIKNLLPQGSISQDTRLVITNAIYFNAAWQIPFDAMDTKAAPFTRPDGTQADVQTMSGYREVPYGSGPDYAAVELPYDGNELSMMLILPPQGTLDAFEASLTPDKLTTIASGMSEHGVTITLPRFKIESTLSLGDQLAKLGMPIALSDMADFSGMDGKTDLLLSGVVHKAFVDVGETGTEAAAATGAVVGTTSVPPLAEIHLDHSYLFLIRDNATRTILFLGRVEDPSP